MRPPPRRNESECPSAPTRLPDVRNLVGLALSGGGIRSASFNLGVLQGLAERNVLWIFDYLSTVSGGGFVGAWWTAWLSRAGREPQSVFPEAEELEPQRREGTAQLLDGGNRQNAASLAASARHEAGRPEASVLAERDDPIHFLRTFSNYLTPRTGLASPDTWRMIVWYTRSLFFTWAALLPLACAAIILAQAFFLWNSTVAHEFLCTPSPAGIEATTTSSGAPNPPVATASLGKDTFCTQESAIKSDSRSARLEYIAKPFALVVTAGLTLALLWLAHSSARPVLAMVAIAFTVTASALLVSSLRTSSSDGSSWSIPIAALVTVLLYGRYYLLARKQASAASRPGTQVRVMAGDLRAWLTQQQARLFKIGTAVFLLLLLAGFSHDIVWFFLSGSDSVLMKAVKRSAGWGGLLLSVVSAAYTAIKAAPTTVAGSKTGPGKVGRILISIAPFLVLLALTLGLATVSREFIAKTMVLPPNILVLANVVVWFALLEVLFAIFESWGDPVVGAEEGTFNWRRFVPHFIVSAIGHQPADISGQKRPWYYLFSPRGWARLGAFAGLATILGLSRNLSLGGASAALKAGLGTAVSVSILAIVAAISWVPRRWKLALRSARPAVLLAIASATAVLTILANGGVANRAQGSPMLAAFLWIAVLVGAVIGLGWLADPNLLSMHGFYKGRLTRAYLGASNNSRRTEEITDAAPGDDINLTDTWSSALGGPYHLINTTLSLVGGSDLATSQRSAENFIMSKYHCGSARSGYRCTKEYMSGELTLGTAAAVSGAAVSPTMGSKKVSAALSLLLSLMSVRLGYWAPTPSGRRWNEPHARLWPFYLLRETLANTGKIGTYCYLTDGGHFDNTGVYALIERGCRYIVCCDCGADPEPGFDDIGNAIRRCRIDFGTEITLDLSRYAKQPPNWSPGLHVVKGKIEFQEAHLRLLGLDPTPESRAGVLLWIKPVVRDRDAADVRQYKLADPDFPQQSTADQWYDEIQFESYRRLGYDAAREAFQTQAAAPALRRGDFGNISGLFYLP
jgi:hypothetical protein